MHIEPIFQHSLLGLRVEGSKYRVSGLGFRKLGVRQVSGFRIKRFRDLGFRAWGLGLGVLKTGDNMIT